MNLFAHQAAVTAILSVEAVGIDDKWLCVACSQYWYIFGQERDLRVYVLQEQLGAARKDGAAQWENGDCPMIEELKGKKCGRPLN
ncbi:hypothetical protein N7510_001929 [Penicillium lagena]|uniref:uncharacterized protein n=1 Tax=Penicillium lagena TaxID=94218 RepID=UPI00253FBAC6|nr:uncharacterized protein N7510_001929 [Penicillium lagena]KAJ5625620.1 hypothetical protein N7510_001929 [Penicillium lagena]